MSSILMVCAYVLIWSQVVAVESDTESLTAFELPMGHFYRMHQDAQSLRGTEISDSINPDIIYAADSTFKRSDGFRLCGTKLIDAIRKICNGCVKPIGYKQVEYKRGSYDTMFRKRSNNLLVQQCCVSRCTQAEMRAFCCDRRR